MSPGRCRLSPDAVLCDDPEEGFRPLSVAAYPEPFDRDVGQKSLMFKALIPSRQQRQATVALLMVLQPAEPLAVLHCVDGDRSR
jgi:hypothetical protein